MKYINVTPEMIEQLTTNLMEQLTGSKALADKLTVSMPIKIKAQPEDKPTIYITTIAERKIKALVDTAKVEVAWHGTVTRDVATNSYYIEDIFVFPQEVTASTADATDDYLPWLGELEDEVFNKLRFHGHSHVYMSTNPSAIDKKYQENMLAPIKDFYIFAIYNKKDDYTMFLYDMGKNYMYETEDIIYISELTEAIDWAAEQIDEKVVKHIKVTPVGFGTSAKNKDKNKNTKHTKKKEKELSVYEKAQRELHPELYSPPAYDWRTDYGYGGFGPQY